MVSLLDMYLQVIFSSALFILSARVFKFLHFKHFQRSKDYAVKYVRLEEVIYIDNKQ